MLVIILDLNMWKNQIFYDPFTFGQYTDSEGYIYSVQDQSFLNTANQTMLSYEWRSQNINPATNESYLEADPRMNSKYLNFALALKGIAFIPSIVAFLTFGSLIWRYGREEFVVEKVTDDVHNIDGIVIEDVEIHEKLEKESAQQNDEVSSGPVSQQNKGRPTSELPSDQVEGTPVLKSVQMVSNM